MADKMVSVLLPESLVDRVAEQWERMHDDPDVAAISPRYTQTGAVRVALHLALKQLEAPAKKEG